MSKFVGGFKVFALLLYMSIIFVNIAVVSEWFSLKNQITLLTVIFSWIYIAGSTYIMVGGDHFTPPLHLNFAWLNLLHVVAVLLCGYTIYYLIMQWIS